MKGTEWEKFILQFLFHKLILNDTFIVMVESHAATLRITYRYVHANESAQKRIVAAIWTFFCPPAARQQATV